MRADMCITLLGPEVGRGPRGPGLGLVPQKGATSTLERGALLRPASRVDLALATGEDALTLEWREPRGPPAAGPLAPIGLDLRLSGPPNSAGARLRTVLDWFRRAGHHSCLPKQALGALQQASHGRDSSVPGAT